MFNSHRLFSSAPTSFKAQTLVEKIVSKFNAKKGENAFQGM